MYVPDYDAWGKNASAKTSMRRKAYCRVIFAGRDITNQLYPFLLSLRIIDGAEVIACEIEVDDRDARLDLPPVNSAVQAEIGWVTEGSVVAFNGFTNDIEYKASRSSGRRMTVRCHGQQPFSKLREPMQQYMGAGAPPGSEMGMAVPLFTAASKFLGSAGGSIVMHPQLRAITNDYWSQINESAIHWARRIADTFGAKMRVENGSQIVMTIPGQNVNGGSTSVPVVWGDNLIALEVHPISAKSAWMGANQQFYSLMQGNWQQIAQKFGMAMPFGASQATFWLPAPAPNSSMAGQQAQGQQEPASNISIPGHIVIVGEPTATSQGGHAAVAGVRPGVDGDYIINKAEHLYSRESGYITNLTVFANMEGFGGTAAPGAAYTATPDAPATTGITTSDQPAPSSGGGGGPQGGAPFPHGGATGSW